MANAGTPDWWLDRLYKRLRDRQSSIKEWDDLYTGNHPAPQGYEKAGPMLLRLLDTLGLNMLAVVSDAPLGRMTLQGFKVNGVANDDIWDVWQANNFDRGSRMVRQEKLALSEAYALVDPNNGAPILTPEHPEQAIVEYMPGSRARAAGLKVWQDDLGATPVVRAMVYLPDGVYSYAAPTRVYANVRSALAMKPMWEFQPNGSGGNSLGEVPLVPFPNRARMLRSPYPEFQAAIRPQKRINKTLMDRMSMQDAGAFKAKWATGLQIPEDPETGQAVEPFQTAIDRLFVNENEKGSFGQFEAEDIKQILDAVRDDVADCAMLVATSPDHILGKLVNVSGDGLKLAQAAEIQRVRDLMDDESDSLEDVARLALIAAGKSVPNAHRMTTDWRNPEYRTDTEQANAAVVALNAGMPHEAVWERYFNASPDEVKDWRQKLDAAALDPVSAELLAKVRGSGPGNGA